MKTRFLAKTLAMPNGCWEWQGSRDRLGYGSFWAEGRSHKAHRVSYSLHKGDPAGRHVMHTCDNRACVCPEHLTLGTHLDNMRDKCVRGRSAGKLNRQQVLEIYSSKDAGATCARRHGVSPATVSEIRSGKHWHHITGATA